jgi:hypothetical protein
MKLNKKCLKEIRNIQQEIAWAAFAKAMSIKPESIECADRVLERLKAECGKLRTGMKPSAGRED